MATPASAVPQAIAGVWLLLGYDRGIEAGGGKLLREAITLFLGYGLDLDTRRSRARTEPLGECRPRPRRLRAVAPAMIGGRRPQHASWSRERP